MTRYNRLNSFLSAFFLITFIFLHDLYAVNISADVPFGLTLELKIVDQLTGAQIPSLDFGELVRTGNKFRSSKSFKVFLTVNAAGDPLELTQLGTALARDGGTEKIPNGAFIVKPMYVTSDNTGASQPSGSTVGAVGTAVGTRLLFNDLTGSSRIITLVYTLSGDPNTNATETIPLSQKSGSYSGVIQFTLTTS